MQRKTKIKAEDDRQDLVITREFDVAHVPEEVDVMTRLGYPLYLLTIISIWKLLGVIAVLVPRFPLVKEWAYAGFFFVMTGAVASHIARNDAAIAYFGPALLIVLTITSWYFRPANRKLVSTGSR